MSTPTLSNEHSVALSNIKAQQVLEKNTLSRQPDKCWGWIGHRDRKGYGIVKVQGMFWRAHRYVYTHFVGPIPDDFHIHHKCRNTSCVNPAHLEPSDTSHCGENQRLRTHCPQGHKYTFGNTRVYKGRRYCRTCNKIRAQQRRLNG